MAVTFGELQEMAWPAALSLQEGRAALDASGAAWRAARARRLPGVDAQGSGSWVSEVQELSLPGRTVRFGDGLGADLAILGTWAVYAGGALAAGEESAAHEHGARQQELVADSLALLAELRSGYILALAAQAGEALARQALARLERHHAEVEGRRRAGLATVDEELAVQGRVAAARQEHALRTGDQQLAALELGRLAGCPGTPFLPAEDLELAPPAEDPSDTRLPAERILLARERALESRVSQEAAAARPRVELQAGWHLGRPGVDPIANDWMDYGAASLRLRLPLWDNQLVRQRTAAARAEHRRLGLAREQVSRDLQARQAGAGVSVSSAERAWQAAVSRTAIEQKRLERIGQRWQQGLASQQAWLDANDDLHLAEQQQALASARLRLAEAARLAAWGH